MTPLTARAEKIWQQIHKQMQFRGIVIPEQGRVIADWLLAELQAAYEDGKKDSFNNAIKHFEGLSLHHISKDMVIAKLGALSRVNARSDGGKEGV